MSFIAKLHADEVDIDLNLVTSMLASQFPQWAALAITPVAIAGTDNVMLRLGDELYIRLPRTPSAAAALERENRYPPLLSRYLPVPVPVPLEQGRPQSGYPFNWCVGRWIHGTMPVCGEGSHGLAQQLGEFVHALHAIPVADPELQKSLTSYRGGPLSDRDALTRSAIAQCGDYLETDILLYVWETVSQRQENSAGPCWIHTDIQPGNLLINEGKLAAVIDWGGMAIGDPAVDLIVAWNLLSQDNREDFKRAVDTDKATWLRGRAWALSIGVIAYAYYVEKDPALARTSRYQIEQVAAEMGLTL